MTRCCRSVCSPRFALVALVCSWLSCSAPLPAAESSVCIDRATWDRLGEIFALQQAASPAVSSSLTSCETEATTLRATLTAQSLDLMRATEAAAKWKQDWIAARKQTAAALRQLNESRALSEQASAELTSTRASLTRAQRSIAAHQSGQLWRDLGNVALGVAIGAGAVAAVWLLL